MATWPLFMAQETPNVGLAFSLPVAPALLGSRLLTPLQ